MGLGDDGLKMDPSQVKQSKGRKKKGEDDEDAVEDTGCWINLKLIGSCISSRSKVENSVSGISTLGKVLFLFLIILFTNYNSILAFYFSFLVVCFSFDKFQWFFGGHCKWLWYSWGTLDSKCRKWSGNLELNLWFSGLWMLCVW